MFSISNMAVGASWQQLEYRTWHLHSIARLSTLHLLSVNTLKWNTWNSFVCWYDDFYFVLRQKNGAGLLNEHWGAWSSYCHAPNGIGMSFKNTVSKTHWKWCQRAQYYTKNGWLCWRYYKGKHFSESAWWQTLARASIYEASQSKKSVLIEVKAFGELS